MASITFPNKQTGDFVYAEEINEIKVVVNQKQDASSILANTTASFTTALRTTLQNLADRPAVSGNADNALSIGTDGAPYLASSALGGGGGGAVTSVNGKTGGVVLTAADVGAAPADHAHPNYALTGHTHPNATTAVPGFMSNVDKAKLNTVEEGAQRNPTLDPAGLFTLFDAMAADPDVRPDVILTVEGMGFLSDISGVPRMEEGSEVAAGEEKAVFATGGGEGGVTFVLKDTVNWTLASELDIATGNDSSEHIAVGPGELHSAFTWRDLGTASGTIAISGQGSIGGETVPVLRGSYRLTGNATVALAAPHNLDPVTEYQREFENTAGSNVTLAWTGADFRPGSAMWSSGSGSPLSLAPGEIVTLIFRARGSQVLIYRGETF